MKFYYVCVCVYFVTEFVCKSLFIDHVFIYYEEVKIKFQFLFDKTFSDFYLFFNNKKDYKIRQSFITS